jgi:hypothetical protein
MFEQPENAAAVDRIREAVMIGGGDFVGIQTTIEGPPLILFNSPQTGTSLSVYYQESWEEINLIQAVSGRIQRSDAEFADRKIGVKASILKRIADNLSAVVTELNELSLGEREKCPSQSKK